jgi:glutamate N-acetyltransferase/amino-acid N-acetyltransferase
VTDSFERLTDGGITSALGYRAGATFAGIKTAGEGKLDLAVLISDAPASAAGVFTRNRVKSPSVVLDQERLSAGVARALVVNSGCANTCTGAEGYADAVATASRVARRWDLPEAQVLVSSTGVIGVRLPMDRIASGLERVEPRPDGGADFARAIMTTDTRPKSRAVRLALDGTTVTVGGAAKGSGMIHPDMATMLAYVTTDAAVPPELLRAAVRRAVDRSFNCVTVDGDSSTNDSLIVFANGRAGGRPIEAGSPAADAFQAALEAVCVDLAREIARDGEGATRLIEVLVEAAADEADARRAARTVAGSPLVKAAVYGNDPNWGRIMMALGRSGAALREETTDLWIGEVQVMRQGRPLPFDEAAASAAMRAPEVRLRARIGVGDAHGVAWGCDLTEEYVRINSEYTT